MSPFSEWLRSQFRERGWETLREAEVALSIDHSLLSKWQNDRERPGRKNVKKLAAGLNVSRDHIEGLLDAGRPEGTNPPQANKSSFTESLQPANNGGPSGDRALILAIQLHNRATHLTVENFRELQVGLDTLLERLEKRQQE